MYNRPVNLSSEFRKAVQKLSNGRMELMFVPAGATGRYQVHDTHLHKPLKEYARKLASLWCAARMKVLNQMRSTETSSISADDYQSRVSKLMSVVMLRNKAPEWLWLAVQHTSKEIPDEDRNLIKKGWDQLYRDPMREEGFLSRARQAKAVWQEAHKEATRKARDQAIKEYILIHGNLDGFDMEKDYTKDYPQEDVLRGLEVTVQTVESTFHAGCVWTVLVDLVCDSLYCLYDSLHLFCRCLHCNMYLRYVLNDMSRYTAVKCQKSPRKERASLEKSARARETIEMTSTRDRGCGLRCWMATVSRT